MTRFLLLPGGGGAAYVWHHVVDALTARGHLAVAVDLPAEDPAAGLEEYADVAAAAARAAAPDEADAPWTVVGLSLGAFTAPLLAARLEVAELVLINPMVPTPGESASAWWAATGQSEAMAAAARAGGYPSDFDLEGTFLHDVDPGERVVLAEHEREELGAAFEDPWPLRSWPDVPVRVVASASDRLFPADFVARVARARLDVATTVVPGGHLSPLSRPAEMTAALLGDGVPAAGAGA
ncbi:alpha/beta hydrolase [Nocardioides zeae]|uniref:Alpha/beta hydrolase n=1 Tax=Nocardioides imazamoxiresistens TaxID=3231893 RepID=A0ABU3Q1C7_9ACTN|nr:alpha/beta hydrolase [Nocardioides zeae]MDT9595308.1 alpha/beta hydrolase [Nocardioides zeae]